MGTFTCPGSPPPSPPSPPSDVDMIDIDDLEPLDGSSPSTTANTAEGNSSAVDNDLWWREGDGHGLRSGDSPPQQDEFVRKRTYWNLQLAETRPHEDLRTPPRARHSRRVNFGSPLECGRTSRVPSKGILKKRSSRLTTGGIRLPKISPAKRSPAPAPKRVLPAAAPRATGGMTASITSGIKAISITAFNALIAYFARPEPQPIQPVLIKSSTANLDLSPATRKRRAVDIEPPAYQRISDHEYRRKRQKNAAAGFYTTATGSPGAPFTPEKEIAPQKTPALQLSTAIQMPTEAQTHTAPQKPTEAQMSTATRKPTEAQKPDEAAKPAALTSGEDANKARSPPRIDTWRKSFAEEVRARKAFNERVMATQVVPRYSRKKSHKFQPLTPPSSRPNTGDSSKAPAADFAATQVTPEPTYKLTTTRASPKDVTRDSQIDDLIARTLKHRLTPTRPTVAERKAAEDAAKKEAEAEKAAQEQAAQELAAQKLAAEKQAAEEQAAREAAAAKKAQIIRDVPSTSVEVIMGELANAKPTKAISKLGSFILSSVSYQRILSDKEDNTTSWLDDEAVNAWFYALCAAKNKQAGWQKSSGTTPPFACFNTGWYNTLKNGGSLARWAKKQGVGGKNILQCERFFLPINSGAHWQLLIINGTDRSIEFLCSLGDRGTPELKLAHKWLAAELGKDYHAGEWTDLKRSSNTSQRQSNSSDCGVFTCFNGLAAAQNTSYKEVTAKQMKMARKMMATVLYAGAFEGDYEL